MRNMLFETDLYVSLVVRLRPNFKSVEIKNSILNNEINEVNQNKIN